MSETERIVDRLNRSVNGEAWHGPALAELLGDVDATRAAARPLTRAHTIWEIALHATVWREQIRLRLRGDTRKNLPPDEDWPPQPTRADEVLWKNTVARLHRAHEALAAETVHIDDSRLDQPIGAGFSSVHFTLHGVIQHNLYHAGQIAVLKRA